MKVGKPRGREGYRGKGKEARERDVVVAQQTIYIYI